jgi:hypothetical protein
MDKYNIKRYYSPSFFVESCVNEMARIADDKDSEFASIAIICNEELVQELFKYFIFMDFDGFTFDMGYIDFEHDYEDGDYAICITNDGFVSIDKTHFDDGKPKIFGEDLVYIHEYSKQSLKKFQEDWHKDGTVIAFSLGNGE